MKKLKSLKKKGKRVKIRGNLKMRTSLKKGKVRRKFRMMVSRLIRPLKNSRATIATNGSN